MSYLDTYILILRANKKQRMKIWPNKDIILGTGSTLQSHFKLSILRANKKQRMKISPNMDIIVSTGSTLQSHFKLSISID